jgi:hypothetical protein
MMSRTRWLTSVVPAAAFALVVLLAAAGPLTGPAPQPTPGVLNLQDILLADPADSPASCEHVDYGEPATRMEPVHADAGGWELPPPNPDGPTQVDVFLFILAIDQIDPATNSFQFETYAGMSWCDPRLSVPEGSAQGERRVFSGEQVRSKVLIWWPRVIFPTQLGTSAGSNEELIVYPNGTVHFSGKFHLALSARYDFSGFPLDRQVLRIPVQSRIWQAEDLVFHEVPNQVGFSPIFEIPEWKLLAVRTAADPALTSDGRERFSRVVMELEIRRKSGFYLWKVLLPLMVIFGVAWTTFWMTWDALAQRQRQSATAVLTLMAFQFVFTGDLPRVPYVTLMDAAILWTLLVIGASFVTNIVAMRRFRHDQGAGRRTDRVGRWVYPVVYAGGLLLVLGWRVLFL